MILVQYYNLSKFSATDGTMSIYVVTSELTKQWFGIGIIFIVFLVSTYFMSNSKLAGNVPMDMNRALNYSSLYSVILSLIF